MKGLCLVATFILALTMYGCGGSSSSGTTPDDSHQIVGMVALPEATDQVYTVYLDEDGDPATADDVVATFQHFCDCGIAVEYYFDGVPPGEYYLYAGTLSEDGLTPFFGYYDPTSEFGVTTEKPAAANVLILAYGSYTFSFDLGVVGP